jgi:glycosyltransferase involved in cell wall biosynthesis
MTRVLLVCPEPLGHGQPAGIGIRFVEMAKVLRADGHTVTLLTPDGDPPISPASLRAASEQNDLAVVQGHVANDLFAHAKPIPTVVDLYDPFIVENFHYHAARGAEIFRHDHVTLVNSLLRGDAFLCASEAQRLFYLGALLAVGRLNPVAFERDAHFDALVRIAPFGVEAPRPIAPADLDAPAILFGGVYDWYDPILAIDAVAIARARSARMTLTFTRHPNPSITPQGKLAGAIDYASRKGYDFVRFEPWAPYGERGLFFDRFALALLTFRQSIETDLSMRTRIYDDLWAALPIVTSSAPGTDELLTRYGAGTIVKSDDAREFAAALVAVIEDRARYDAMRNATRAFVAEHSWPETLAPLRALARAPRFDATKQAFAMPLPTPQQPSSSSPVDQFLRRIARGVRRRLRRPGGAG